MTATPADPVQIGEWLLCSNLDSEDRERINANLDYFFAYKDKDGQWYAIQNQIKLKEIDPPRYIVPLAFIPNPDC